MFLISYTLTILILFSLLYYLYRINKGFSIESFIVGLYTASVISSLYLNDTYIKEYSFASTFFLIILYLLTFIPFISLKSNHIIEISLPSLKLFKLVSYIFIVLGIASYVFFLPIVYRLFTSDLSILTIRTDMVGGVNYYETGLLYFMLTFYCQFYPIVLILYFYSISFLKNGTLFNNLLLFSSTGYIINVLASMGRDGFVLWLLSYLFAFILFRNFLTPLVKARQIKFFKIISSVFIVFFLSITISRFFQDDSTDVINSIVSYYGQQFGNFHNQFNHLPFLFEGSSGIINTFPILNIMEDKSSVDFLDMNLTMQNKYGFDPNVFSAFFGSFYFSMGFWKTLIVCFFLFLISKSIMKNKKKHSLGNIFLITLVCQISLHGVFYYKLGYSVSNLYMISVLFLAVLFTIKFKFK